MSLSKIIGAGVLLGAALHAGPVEAHYPLFPRVHRLRANYCAAVHGGYGSAVAPIHGATMAPMMPCDPCDPCGGYGVMQQPIYGTQLQAVPQTTLVPQQVVTYQTVPQIQMQRQAYVEQVPVTTYQNVTRYRDVAVQVNTQVPQIQTQMVPQTRMSYVPVTTPIGTQITGVPYGVGGIYSPIPTTAIAPGIAPIPETAGVPTPSSVTQPPPYIQGASSSENWSTIRQQGTPAPPTAATVWQSQLQSGAVAR